MNKSMRLPAGIIMVFFVILIPLAYGINFGVTSGKGGAYDSVGIGIVAASDSSVNGIISVNGASLSPTFSTTGITSLEKSQQVTDGSGNLLATTYAKVTKGKDIVYSEAKDASSATQQLSVKKADYIFCSENAFGLEGDKASTSLEIAYGSLTNYIGQAGITDGYPIAMESSDAITGKSITLTADAYNHVGDEASASTNAIDATIAGSQNIAAVGMSSPFGEVFAWQSSDDIKGRSIKLNATAYNHTGDKASASTNVTDGTITKSTNVAAIGMSSPFGELFAGQGFFIGSIGSNITGKGITLTATAYNHTGDKASASTNVTDGTIANSENVATMSKGLMLVGQISDEIKGTDIKLTATAYNHTGDKASAGTNVTGGTITNSQNIAVVGVSSPFGEVIAGNGVYSSDTVTGKQLVLTASATNSTGSSVSNTTVVLKPKETNYANLAGVVDGSPVLFQSTV